MKYPSLEDKDRDFLITLIEDMSKRWIAHDGLWFQAIEKELGLAEAIKFDTAAWDKFARVEADRIKKLLKLPDNGGIPALKTAFGFRLGSFINKQEIIDVDENRIIFRMNDCRVQSARKRKGLPDFPCKPVGLLENSVFAETIDPRIKTKCISCPPDRHPDEYFCAWEFYI